MNSKKKKLSELAAEEVQDRIANGEWSTTLPNEHGLADVLQISRRVTRESLLILEKSGIISAPVRGKRRSILTIPDRHQSISVAVYFMPYSLDNDLSSMLTVKEITSVIIHSGMHVVTPAHNELSHADLTDVAIGAFFNNSKVDAWILLRPARAVVEYTLKHKIPVFCLGGDIIGLNVPSIVDNRTKAIYEGTKILLAAGHSRIVAPFRQDRHPSAGLNHMQEAMKKAFDEHKTQWSQQYHAPYWSGETKSYCEMLAEQFKVTRPTAFILGSYSELMPLLSYMNFMRLRIGEDISIIINQKHPELEHILPGIDTFEFDERKLIQQACSEAKKVAIGISDGEQKLIDMAHHKRKSVQSVKNS